MTYPIATISPYGPDASLATKLVVAIHRRPRDRNPVMREWETSGQDVRNDPMVSGEVASFIQEHRAHETVSADRIIGCPHEEGIDYPLGRTCPQCPFWAGLDRFTHEPLPVATATLPVDEVLAVLSREHSVQPQEALESADAHQAALVDPLLAAMERVLADPVDVSDADAILFAYALYLLAKWREPRAYPFVVRWLSLPEEVPFEIAGDVVTQDGARMLAAVCDGDLEPLKRLAAYPGADEYGRGAAIGALALVAAWAEVPRDRVIEVLRWLAQEGLEREPSHAWDSLVGACHDVEAVELFDLLRDAYQVGLVDRMYMAESELDRLQAAPRGRQLAEIRERHPPIDDVADDISWWSSFSARKAVPARTRKIGRNEPCPCGSGKKYKKCCGA